MLIAGAGGHALETLDVILESVEKRNVAFFDDVSDIKIVHDFFPVLKNELQVREWFKKGNEFCLGVGRTDVRKLLVQKLQSYGGTLVGLRAKSAEVSSYAKNIHSTVDLFKQTFVSSLCDIGFGTLINNGAKIHHHVKIGEFCEISPGVIILGGAEIGNNCFIGGGAKVLPKVRIVDNVIIGAGAVVVKNIVESGTYVESPARRIK